MELFRYFGLHNPWAAGADKSDMPLQAESGQLLLNRWVAPPWWEEDRGSRVAVRGFGDW